MPLPLMISEGQNLDHFGNLIWSTYIDFRHPTERQPIATLVKGCEEQYAIEIIEKVRISKPWKFRDFGENLIRDPDEARPQRTEVIQESIDDPRVMARAKQRDWAMNRASHLVGANWKTRTTSVRSTYSEGQSFTFGKNGWIFCTSVEPSTPDEWEQWHDTLEQGYNHVSCIYRPRAFARELASMVAEHLGTQGRPASLTHTFEGIPTLRTEHPLQMIFHGPVIYVDDVYSLIEAATSKQELMLLPLFAKSKKYKGQREYRFVIWAETEPEKLCEDIPASPAMLGNIRGGKRANSPQWVPDSESTKDGLVLPARDTEDKENRSSDLDEENQYGLGRSIMKANSLETELFRTFSRAKGPATVYRPHKVSPDDLPNDFQAMTATYSSVRALQNKVRDFQEVDEETSERRLGVSSAAWYAEQDIRALCQMFDDPISGISISPDGYIVIHVSLSALPEIECKLAVAPSGESIMRLEAPRRQSIQRREYRLPGGSIAKGVREFVEDYIKDAALSGREDVIENTP